MAKVRAPSLLWRRVSSHLVRRLSTVGSLCPGIAAAIALVLIVQSPAESARAWSQVDREGIYIQYHQPNRLAAEELLEEAVVARQAVSEFLLYRPKVQVRILLASDRDEFREILGDTVPDWGGGIAFPDRGAIILFMPNMAEWEKPLPAILRHEIAHIVLHAALKGRAVPRWFDEGLAMYQSREWRPEEGLVIAKAVLFRSLIPLNELIAGFPRHVDQASLAYQESYSAINYIVDRYGEDGLRGLVFSLMAGQSFEGALRSEFGLMMSEFEDRWATWLRARYRWVVILSHPEVYLGLMTFLFIVAFIAVKLRNRRKLARWEREEKIKPDS